ncbi:hypothetical protein FO519_010047, partial [Halicephalobus sp. NKZ332]
MTINRSTSVIDWLQQIQKEERIEFPFEIKVTDGEMELEFPLSVKFILPLIASKDIDIQISVTYHENIMSREKVTAIISHLINGIKFIMNSKLLDTKVLNDIELLSEEEKPMVLNLGKSASFPAAGVNTTQCLHELFEEQVILTPQKTALLYEDGKQISYEELNRMSNGLATVLLQYSENQPLGIIPLLLEKEYAPIAVLSVLKSGGAFVPLDLRNPVARNMYIINEVNARLLISTNNLLHQLNISDLPHVKIICLDDVEVQRSIEELSSLTSNAKLKEIVRVNPQDLAYVMYTSGTTGEPKGVMIEHHAIVNSMIGHREEYVGRSELRGNHRVLQYANYCFDAFLGDVFTSIISGDTLCIASQDRLLNDLSSVINHFGITRLKLTPTVANLLDPAEFTSLKMLILGGEAVPNHLIEKWIHHVIVINIYGPTEATIINTTKSISLKNTNTRSIGRPFGVNRVLILDENLKVLPINCVGEICLAGPQLARGYLNKPEMTAKAFVETTYE